MIGDTANGRRYYSAGSAGTGQGWLRPDDRFVQLTGPRFIAGVASGPGCAQDNPRLNPQGVTARASSSSVRSPGRHISQAPVRCRLQTSTSRQAWGEHRNAVSWPRRRGHGGWAGTLHPAGTGPGGAITQPYEAARGGLVGLAMRGHGTSRSAVGAGGGGKGVPMADRLTGQFRAEPGTQGPDQRRARRKAPGLDDFHQGG